MSPFGLKFSQMIFHTETSKQMYNWSFWSFAQANTLTQYLLDLKDDVIWIFVMMLSISLLLRCTQKKITFSFLFLIVLHVICTLNLKLEINLLTLMFERKGQFEYKRAWSCMDN